MNARTKRFCFLTLGIVLSGCGEQVTDNAIQVAGQELSQSPAVAWVNNSVITEDDVVRSIVTTLGPEAVEIIPDSTKKTVIEGLVTSRAMAQAAEATLDEEGLISLNAEVAAFREQLLVKYYLREHARPVPVTEKMIRDFYDSNPERFGGGQDKVIEIVSAGVKQGENDRASLMAQIAEFERQPNWRAFSNSLKARGEPVRYARTVYDANLLDHRLRATVEQLTKDQVSATIIIDGLPHRVKVVEVEERQARALEDVRGEVKNMLLPEQVKLAIKQVSGQVVSQADIRYPGDGNGLEK